MKNEVQQIMNILYSMNEKLGRIQSSISESESSIDKSAKEDCQFDNMINEVDIMNKLLVKILGSLNKAFIAEVSFTHNETYTLFGKELLTIISFKSITDEKELFEIVLNAEEADKFGEIARALNIPMIDKEDGGFNI